jgi:hypothetical protein
MQSSRFGEWPKTKKDQHLHGAFALWSDANSGYGISFETTSEIIANPQESYAQSVMCQHWQN